MTARLNPSLESALRSLAQTPTKDPDVATYRGYLAVLLAEIDHLRTGARDFAATVAAGYVETPEQWANRTQNTGGA